MTKDRFTLLLMIAFMVWVINGVRPKDADAKIAYVESSSFKELKINGTAGGVTVTSGTVQYSEPIPIELAEDLVAQHRVSGLSGATMNVSSQVAIKQVDSQNYYWEEPKLAPLETVTENGTKTYQVVIPYGAKWIRFAYDTSAGTGVIDTWVRYR